VARQRQQNTFMTAPGADTADDRALLSAARAGDRDALEALLARYQPMLFRFGMKMCGDVEDARDVLQETSLAMARSLGDFRADSTLSTWLYAIARSFCTRKRRRSRYAPARVESLDAPDSAHLADLPASGQTPEQAAAGEEVRAALDAAIRSLEPAQREVLVLRDIEGLSAAEVGEVLGLKVAAVKSRLHRARLAVRQQLAPILAPAKAERVADRRCPDVLTAFSRHLEGELGPDACSKMEAHLAGCEACRGTCESLKRALALCRSTPSIEVPAAVQQSVRQALRAHLAQRRG
jgi:RNA polymerase sigma-70 factor (ECF subfamily)